MIFCYFLNKCSGIKKSNRVYIFTFDCYVLLFLISSCPANNFSRPSRWIYLIPTCNLIWLIFPSDSSISGHLLENIGIWYILFLLFLSSFFTNLYFILFARVSRYGILPLEPKPHIWTINLISEFEGETNRALL